VLSEAQGQFYLYL